MNEYEYLLEMKNECEDLGREAETEELRLFYANAAKGFEQRMKNIRIGKNEFTALF